MNRSRPIRLSTLAVAFIAVAACSRPSPSSSPVVVLEAEAMPPLCELDGGRWCRPCDAGPCPQGDSGALCCAGDFCVVWDAGSCGGVLGWCNNYTTETDPDTGINVATCHDTAE